MALFLLPAQLAAQEIAVDSLSADSLSAAVQGYAPGGPTAAAAAAEQASSDAKAVALGLVLPVRSDNQLQQSLRAAEADLERAQARLAWATEAESKRAAESDAGASKEQKRWSARLSALSTAQLEAARQACLAALAKQQALELELQLNQKRAEQASGSPGASKGLKPVIRELERQTLAAQLKHRELAHVLANTEEDVADQRIALYKAAK
jgi:hypothetical protein